MMSALSAIFLNTCLIEVVEGSFVIEPLMFIPAAKVYAKGRQSGFGVKIGNQGEVPNRDVSERLKAVARRIG
jgi:hypothetical protein